MNFVDGTAKESQVLGVCRTDYQWPVCIIVRYVARVWCGGRRPGIDIDLRRGPVERPHDMIPIVCHNNAGAGYRASSCGGTACIDGKLNRPVGVHQQNIARTRRIWKALIYDISKDNTRGFDPSTNGNISGLQRRGPWHIDSIRQCCVEKSRATPLAGRCGSSRESSTVCIPGQILHAPPI